MKENFWLYFLFLFFYELREFIEFFGYYFLVGMEVLVNFFVIYWDLSVYDNFDSFDFDRFFVCFYVDYMSISDFYEFMLFGKGFWMCLGYRLVNMMVVLMLVNFFYVFDWFLLEG